MNKFFRCMICLLLICSLMVSISPIQAEALSPGLAFAAGSAVASALIGLGISMGSDALVHNYIVEGAVDALKAAGYVTAAGTIALTSISSGRYAVSENVLDALRSWLFDVEVVKPGFQAGTGYANYSIGNLDLQFASDAYNIQGILVGVPEGATIKDDTLYTVYVVAEQLSHSAGFDVYGASFVTSYYTTDTLIDTDETSYRLTARMVRGYNGPYYELPMNNIENLKSAILQLIPGLSSTTTDYDVDLNFVANPELSLADGYAEWAANSVAIDGVTYYPIAIGKTQEETQSFTQADVWAGNGTYVDSEVVPGTGSGTVTVPDNATLKDILAGVLTIPQAISIAASNVVAAVQAIPAAIQAIPAAIADFFSVKGEVGSFTISLSDYFPFCIPFDLFNFFECLYADPVAPVIEWSIFERDGTAHPIIIDLSAYDSVAQLLRRLQLLLFCVGLAFKTRDLIKG